MVLFSAVFELNSTIFLRTKTLSFFAHTYKYIVTFLKNILKVSSVIQNR